MSQSDFDSVQQIEAWLDQHRDDIGQRAAARAARTIVWNRRLQRVNVALLAAVLLMTGQVGWSIVMLARLHGAVASVPEIIRLTLS
jgi:hypothetical protein